MNLIKIGESTRTLLYSTAVLALVVITATFVAKYNSTEASGVGNTANLIPDVTIPANAGTLGAIPDSNVGSPVCQNNSTTMRDVTFTVSGQTGTVSTVAVNFNASHTFLQDLEVTLIAPGAQSRLLFAATGTTTTVANSCAGSANDLSSANTYTFADTASANWWTTAATNPVPTSSNRTVVTGIGGTTNPPATTSLNTAFAGSNPNGTWTLRFRDRGAGDTGTVTAANLILTTAGGGDAPVDFNADGKTDFVVVRNTGGGPTGQTTWFYTPNGGGVGASYAWGIFTDFFLPEDYDGDGKDDVAVWRPDPTQGQFYILQSATSTVRIDNFGLTGDDPTMVGDYDGDGKTDVAVYRAGASAGAPSTWYWRGSLTPGSISSRVWGVNGDFPAPGDFDGNGKNDFCVQRDAGGGQAAFWIQTDAGSNSVTIFGTPSDVIVPGDYDGDGKTDIAVTRGVGGSINWFIRNSSNGTTSGAVWGASGSDFFTQGDYDGDGKTDVAIWRPATSGGAFYALGSTGSVVSATWGATGDYPVANYNAH